MVHSMAYKLDKTPEKPGEDIRVDLKPVTVTNYPAMERKY